MSGILSLLLGTGGDSTATFVLTTGTGDVTSTGKSPSTWFMDGWSSIIASYNPAFTQSYPSTFTNSGTTTAPTFKGKQILGLTSRDTSLSNTHVANFYYLYLAGDASAITLNSVSIGGTAISWTSAVATYDTTFTWTPTQSGGVTRFVITPTTAATTLFGTATNVQKTIVIT